MRGWHKHRRFSKSIVYGVMEAAEELLPFQKAQSSVKALYDYTAHYFEQHGVENAARKWEDIKAQMEDAVGLLDSLQPQLTKVQYWSLKGRALNVLPEHSQEAEDCLSRAIKHDPSQVDTWNSLGESYWKVGKIQQAHDCFSGCLAHSKNKESLRNLSMVLRQMGESVTEKEEKTKESLERAKEAVALDVKDGTSWMILGNAYLSVFFMTGQDQKVLKHCISAYVHAEKDLVSANNPDLHYNRATLCQYEEDYQAMLKELALAAALDPVWKAPRERLNSTWSFLTSMSSLISNKGRMKAKAMSNLLQGLSSPEPYLGEEKDRKPVALDKLEEGINLDCVAVVGVAAIVPSKERVPYACVVLDKASNCLGVTFYNLASATHFVVGNILTIPDPVLRLSAAEYNGEVVELRNLQVNDPSKLLLNGRKLAADKLAPSSVSVTAFN